MKYASHFMLLVTVINMLEGLLFFILEPKTKVILDEDNNTANDGTMNMIQADSSGWKVLLVFINSMVVVVFLALLMLYSYSQKYRVSFMEQQKMISQVKERRMKRDSLVIENYNEI